ncbi:hypothetical protein A3L09_05130 [Thermococcus profundus]|uniref:Uncharacterized protein n=1 Tax=Thermococcus profundus TaxID=49899 RepID=A0A2Z2M885_THEPR|nr:hypothetical protein [Thermococcus profundus]ASJ02680.1 hypothetical protein A3L09_05130 [Thermococcus profundus]
MLERVNNELVNFIVARTGLSRETVVRVLKAEEAFFELEVERALNGAQSPSKGGGSGTSNGRSNPTIEHDP